MPKNTVEEYRLSVVANGVRRKLLRHSVEEDETLLVQVRSKPRPTAVGTVVSGHGKTEVSDVRVDRRGLSYHPSGRINIKSYNGKHQEVLTAPPFILIKQPIFLLSQSAAKIEQLDIDDSKTNFGDHCIDLSGVLLRRIHSECVIGPKGAFKGEFVWPWGWAARLVYEDAAFYDVCYFVGERPAPPDDLQKDGVKINQTVLTGTLNQTLLPPIDSNLGSIAPTIWASPSAVARQLRALFEHRYERLRQAIGVENGSYHLKMTMASDGVVAAMEPRPDAEAPSAGWQTFLSLNVDTMLGTVRAANGAAGLADCFSSDPTSTDNIEGAVYISNQGDPSCHYPLVFAARQLLKQRYYRIDPNAIRNVDTVLEMVLRQVPNLG